MKNTLPATTIIILSIAFFTYVAYILTKFTQSELGYTLSYLLGHSVNIPFFLAFIMNMLLNQFILLFDVIISIIRLGVGF